MFLALNTVGGVGGAWMSAVVRKVVKWLGAIYSSYLRLILC